MDGAKRLFCTVPYWLYYVLYIKHSTSLFTFEDSMVAITKCKSLFQSKEMTSSVPFGCILPVDDVIEVHLIGVSLSKCWYSIPEYTVNGFSIHFNNTRLHSWDICWLFTNLWYLVTLMTARISVFRRILDITIKLDIIEPDSFIIMPLLNYAHIDKYYKTVCAQCIFIYTKTASQFPPS